MAHSHPARRLALIAVSGALSTTACTAPAAGPSEHASSEVARAGDERSSSVAAFVLTDVALADDERADLIVDEQGNLRLVPAGTAGPATLSLDAEGARFAPGVIDAHVHLDYLPAADALAAAGLVAAIDLGAPEASLGAAPHPALRIVRTGPLLTRPAGYPLDSWGADGYGLAISSEDEARAAVTRLGERGAGAIKVVVFGDRGLDDATLRAVVEAAHARELPVVAHALGDADVLRAARAGVDVLAHTPTEPLSATTVEALRGRAVISTLMAFGATEAAVENLRRLRAAGCAVLYGTDLGNTRTAALSVDELRLLVRAGLDGPALAAALSTAPATIFGLDSYAP